MKENIVQLPVSNREPQKGSLRLIYILTIICTGAIIFSIVFAFRSGSRISKRHARMIDATYQAQISITKAHLWFEELISGDETIEMEDVKAWLDSAGNYIELMIEGGVIHDVYITGVRDETRRNMIISIRDNLQRFEEVTRQRYETPEESRIGSIIDQQYDTLYTGLIKDIGEFEKQYWILAERDLVWFRSILAILAIVCTGISIVIGLSFGSLIKRHIWDEQQLRASNQQLEAGEQQLRASNQQLLANEQQLKAANQQLQASEQQLMASNQNIREVSRRNEAILGSIPDIIAEVDNNKTYTWVNQAAIDFFGDDVIGSNADYYFEGQQDTYQAVQPLFKGSEDVIYVESWQRRKDGEKRLLGWWCRVLQDANGNIRGALSTARDITEQKQYEEKLKAYNQQLASSEQQLKAANQQLHASEQQLRASNQQLRVSEERFRKITQSSPMGIYLYELQQDGRLVLLDSNPAADAFTGIDNRKLHGKTIEEAFPSLADTEIPMRYREAAANGTPWQTSTLNYEDEKITGAYDVYAFQTSPNRVAVLFVEVTERKQAEQRERLLTERFSRSIENMLEGYALHEAIFDANGRMRDFRYIEFNPAACKIIGYKRENIVGKTAMELFPAIVERGLMDKYADVMATGKPDYIEDFYYEGDRLNKAFDISCFRIDKKHFACIFRDITERRQNMHEREELLKTVQSKNKELQSIVYVASHDLRSPLVNIQGFGGVLAGNCRQLINMAKNAHFEDGEKKKLQLILEEDIPQSLNFIQKGAEKMNALLNGLLQVSRVGTVQLEMDTIDTNKLVTQTLQEMQYQIEEKEVNVSVENLPKCYGDASQTSQVFSNIIQNAIKYFDPARQGKIEISGWIEGGNSIYCFKDNGIGIKQEHKDKIFEIFHQLDPQNEVGGEGLGLTIVSRILERQNGRIWVESEYGQGSSFYVSLPTA